MKNSFKQTFTAILFLLIFCFQVKSQTNKYSEKEIITMIKSFYTAYITETSKMPPDFNKIEVIKKEYCTLSLLNKIEMQELDYDPFLKAQDCDAETLKTLSIKKDIKQKNLFYVSYNDNYTKTEITIKLIIKKENDSYKIDTIY